VNGIALPFSHSADDDDPGVLYTLTSDGIAFQQGGKFVETMTVTATEGGVTTGPAVGTLSGTNTYSSSSGAISLNAGAGEQFTGTTGSVSDLAMPLTDGSDTYVSLPQP
jgi:hypothetical protein